MGSMVRKGDRCRCVPHIRETCYPQKPGHGAAVGDGPLGAAHPRDVATHRSLVTGRRLEMILRQGCRDFLFDLEGTSPNICQVTPALCQVLPGALGIGDDSGGPCPAGAHSLVRDNGK